MLPKKKKTVDTASEAIHRRRRQFIFRRVVLDNRPLSLKEMNEVLNLADTYDDEKIKGDLEHFGKIGCVIALRPSLSDPTDREFTFMEGPHTDDDTIRETINPKEKILVARLAASLICGIPEANPNATFPRWLEDARKTLERMTISATQQRSEGDALKLGNAEDLALAAKVRSVLLHLQQNSAHERSELPLESVDEVLRHCKYSSQICEKNWEALRQNLYQFWHESTRLVAVDSGTTNIMLSRCLKQLHIPLRGAPLCSLTICTNSRRIFHELGPSNVWIKTIIIGGQQRFRTSTIAGTLAEIFLKSISILQFGMCILGATRVDLDQFAVCSDSQEESALKNLLMERSALKVICVDNSKLQSGPGREGYRFASLDPQHIDLLVTNSPLKNGANADLRQAAFLAMVESIQSRGVPVLVATSPETFNYP